MSTIVARWDRHQVPLYLAALSVGAVIGLRLPGLAPSLAGTITPVLALLLFATFLGVPMAAIGRGLRDWRFLTAVCAVNFGAIPLLVWGLSRFVADDAGLLIGVLLVLLTPCVDYVIVFTGLAGGDRARLLAATPLLMVVQLGLLPVFLAWFAGPAALSAIDPAPFAAAFGLLIVLPLVGAALVQAGTRRHPAATMVERAGSAAMVPLMMLTLAVVAGSQIAAVRDQLGDLARVVPLYLVFVPVAAGLGWSAARLLRLDPSGSRAVLFSGVTRNSLVVLPLALALPTELALAPVAVVTQTLVELLALVVLVRLSAAATRSAAAPSPDHRPRPR